MINNTPLLLVDLTINSIVNKLAFYSPFQVKNLFRSWSNKIYPRDYEINILFKFLNISSTESIVTYDFLMEKLYQAITIRNKSKKREKDKNINKAFYKYLKKTVGIEISDFIENEFIDFIFFHGSIGDRTYINGTSDIDILMGINTFKFNSCNDFKVFIKKLSILNSSLIKIDPLQHHGVTLLFDYQYNNYIKSYFPEELIKYGTFLKGNVKLKSTRQISHEKRVLELMKEDVKTLINSKKPMGYYSFKSIISTLLMIMIYKRQIRINFFGFKKEILELIMKGEENIERKLLVELTKFRSDLKYKSSISFINNLSFLNPLVIKALYQIESIIKFYLSKDFKKFNQTKKLIKSYLNE